MINLVGKLGIETSIAVYQLTQDLTINASLGFGATLEAMTEHAACRLPEYSMERWA